MNLKELVITLLVFYFGYHLIIYKHEQSIFYAGGENISLQTKKTPVISGNNLIQNAYRNCSHKADVDFQSKNKHLPTDVYYMLKNNMPDVCKAEILASCNKGLDNPFCRSVLNRFGN